MAGTKKSVKKVVKATAPTKVGAIALPPLMDIAYAQDFHVQLRKATENASELRLNGSAVTRITSPCIQILISAAKTLEGEGGTLKLTQPSGALVAAMNDLGLANEIVTWGV